MRQDNNNSVHYHKSDVGSRPRVQGFLYLIISDHYYYYIVILYSIHIVYI